MGQVSNSWPRTMRETKKVNSQRARDVEQLRASLLERPPPVSKPVLVIVSGLPGSGKSYFSRKLATQIPLLIIESDALRKVLFPTPSYTFEESSRLFNACHVLINDLLTEGTSVLVDATNLVESHRERVSHIANDAGATLVPIYLKANPEVIYQRLKGRSAGVDSEDNSDADWLIYQNMCKTVEPIRREHFVLDTSEEISEEVSKIADEIKRSLGTVEYVGLSINWK